MKRTSKAAARKRFDDAMARRIAEAGEFMPFHRLEFRWALADAWLRGRAQGRKMERKGL